MIKINKLEELEYGCWYELEEVVNMGEDALVEKYGEDWIVEDCTYSFLEDWNNIDFETLKCIVDKINQDETLFLAICEGDGLGSALDIDYDEISFYHKMSVLDVAYEYVDDLYNLPEHIKHYIDYEKFADDLSFDGYVETTYGTYKCY